LNSTVEQLYPTYLGDLRVGDDLTGVPRSTAGATLTVPFRQTTFNVGLTYFGEWIQTDWLAYYGFILGGQPYRGSGRAYWIEYPSIVKFNVSAFHALTPRVTGFVVIDNLGNNRRYEDNNTTPSYGRVSTLGVRVRL
jgi:hypothetical protein